MDSRLANQAYDDYLAYQDKIGGCSFGIDFDDEDESKLCVTFIGEDDTIHKGAIYKSIFSFTEFGNSGKPQGSFCTPVPYHCNIGESGKICVEFFNSWNSKKKFHHFIEVLNYLLYHPNPDNPLLDRKNVAQEMINNKPLYEQKVIAQAKVCRAAFI